MTKVLRLGLAIGLKQIRRLKSYQTMSGSGDISPFLIPRDTPINKLCCGEAFQGLTSKEKKYAHHLGSAGWAGSLICLLQTSPESPAIFLLLQRMFGGQSLSSLKETAFKCGLSEEEYQVMNLLIKYVGVADSVNWC